MNTHVLRAVFRIGWLKSIYINFRLQLFKQAIHLPIIAYRNTHIESLSGRIRLICPASFALIKLGTLHANLTSWRSNHVFLSIKGDMIVNGWIQLGCGSMIVVDKDACLSLGYNTCIGANSRIVCRHSIAIGDYFRAAWDVQILDTNFHFIKDVDSGKVKYWQSSIELGTNNWIGNRSSVMPGTRTNNYFILASNSIANKDYRESVPEFSMMAGCPAKLIKTRICRVLDRQEREIEKMFAGMGESHGVCLCRPCA